MTNSFHCMSLPNLTDVSDRIVNVVSGAPRSGTSMMMRMGVHGGLVAVSDGARKSDIHNPHGYFEDQRSLTGAGFLGWINEAQGRLIKVLSNAVLALPPTHYYRVIFMRRSIEAVLQSQANLALSESGVSWSSDQIRELAEVMCEHDRTVTAELRKRPNVDLLELWYEDVVSDPENAAKQVAGHWELNCYSKISTAVDQTLDRSSEALPRQLRGLVFDLDGVLLDSIPCMEASYYAAASQALDVAPPSFEEFRKHLGRSLPEIVRILGLPLEPFCTLYQRETIARLDAVRVFPGVLDMLGEFQSLGLPMSVATGKDTDKAKRFLRHFGIDKRFVSILGSDAVARPKPAPDLIFRVATEMKIAPQEGLFVGDSVSDLLAGRAASIPTVAALWGMPNREDLTCIRHLADIHHPNQLVSLVKKCSSQNRTA